MSKTGADYQREWRERNPGKHAEHQRKWRKQNPECSRKIQREYYDRNAEACRATKDRYHAKLMKNKERMRDWIVERYGDIPCMECNGVFDWCAMDFDHRPGEVKELKIAQLGWYVVSPKNIASFEKEAAKCDLVCSNCHRVRTHVTRKEQTTRNLDG